MAFAEGTFTDRHDFLTTLASVLSTNGWTIDLQTAGSGSSTEGRLSAHNANGVYVHFLSYNYESGSHPTGIGGSGASMTQWDGLSMICSTGYTASPTNWWEHTGFNEAIYNDDPTTFPVLATTRFGSGGGSYWISVDADAVAIVLGVTSQYYQIVFGSLEGAESSWSGTTSGMYYFSNSGVEFPDSIVYESLATLNGLSSNLRYSNGGVYTPAYELADWHTVNENATSSTDMSGWHSANSSSPSTNINTGQTTWGCYLHGVDITRTSLPTNSSDEPRDEYDALAWCGPSDLTGVSPMFPMSLDLSEAPYEQFGYAIRLGVLSRIRGISHDAFNAGDTTTLPGGEDWVVFPAREDADGLGKAGYCILKD